MKREMAVASHSALSRRSSIAASPGSAKVLDPPSSSDGAFPHEIEQHLHQPLGILFRQQPPDSGHPHESTVGQGVRQLLGDSAFHERVFLAPQYEGRNMNAAQIDIL